MMLSSVVLLVAARIIVQDSSAKAPQQIGLTVPKAPWIMLVPGDPFEVTEHRVKPDGTAGYFC